MIDLMKNWKLVAITVGVTSVVIGGPLGVSLVVQNARLSDMKAERDKLAIAINDPETGYIARLRTCRDNVTTLEASIDTQNQAIEDLKTEAESRIAEAEAAQQNARNEADRLRRRARDILSRPIEGETVCERALNVDEAFLMELTQ